MKDDVAGFDRIDGKDIAQLVVANAELTLRGIHVGTVHVDDGGVLLIEGVLRGTLNVHRGGVAVIANTQQGTVFIAEGGAATVLGRLQGTATLQAGARLNVAATGILAGTLANDGLVVLAGVFGGARSGRGELRIEGSGHIKQPVEIDGALIYHWD